MWAQDEFRHLLELKSKVRCCMDTDHVESRRWAMRRSIEAGHSICHRSSDTQRKRYVRTGKDEMAELLEYRNPITSPLGAT